MKRKPYAYIGNYDDNDDHMYAINCQNRQEALSIMEREFNSGNEQLEYIKPDFANADVTDYSCYFCRKCNVFCPDNICEDCERNLQGKSYRIYEIDIKLK